MREVRLGAGAALVALAVFLIRFLVPRPVGLADNGDGIRLLCQVGGANDLNRPLETFVRFHYGPAPPCDDAYASSQLWLDKGAARLGHWLDDPARLNLFVVGALSIVAMAVAVGIVVAALRLSGRGSAVALAALLLVLADSAFFGYDASVYSEFAAFLGVMLIAGGLLLMRSPGRRHYLGALIVFAGGVLAVNAKPQTLLLLPALAVALLGAARPARDGRGGALRWAAPVLVFAAVAGATVAVQTRDGAGLPYSEVNMYHAIFHGIVDGKHDSVADLAALGLPPSFARYAGSTWWAPVRATQDPRYPRYEHLISKRNVLRYYATHPVRTAQLLQQAGTELLTARPDYLGSFDEASGLPPRSAEYRVPALSGLTSWAAPLGLALLLPWWLLLAVLGIHALLQGVRRSGSADAPADPVDSLHKRDKPDTADSMTPGREQRAALGLVVCFLVLAAGGQYLIAALGEGVEGVKHQVIALFCALLGTVFAALTALRPHPVRPAATSAAEGSTGTGTVH